MPHEVIAAIYRRIRTADIPNVWITLLDESAVLDRVRALEETAIRAAGGGGPGGSGGGGGGAASRWPLLGIPFAVKDNIDVAGVPTTAACKDFAYTPQTSSALVEKLEAAGAILLGKTNLDQFATGLTGLLSSYGPTRNPFNSDYISGGSSSGSAVVVAAGLVSFALGTDTAGSGRIPAAFNHLVGLKPTRGLLSTRGIFPACRSLDCPSILALNVEDAAELLSLTKGFDSADPYSRPEANHLDLSLLKLPISSFRFGVPRRDQLDFFGDTAAEALYQQAIERLRSLGGERIEIDAAPFLEAGRLLYQGPWVAERLASMDAFHADHPDAFHPVTRSILDRGRTLTAVDTFRAQHQLEALRRRARAQWALMDLLLLPTAGTIPTVAEAQKDPAAASARLGLYTNFVNLLDLAAVALPAGLLPAPRNTPWGITLIAPAFSEPNLVALSQRFHPDPHGGLYGVSHSPQSRPLLPFLAASPPSFPEPRTLICVVGAHLSGQPLNYQLTELDGQLVRRGRTASHYRLYALANTTPPKPGLLRAEGGTAIDVEVWSLPDPAVASFLGRVPPPLCLGNIQLDNGDLVKGFLVEPFALHGATDISRFGGWGHYLVTLAAPADPATK
jgi:allophanate hydrolase